MTTSHPATVHDPTTEQEAIALFDKLMAEGKEWKRRATASDWDTAKDYWKGDHWPESRGGNYVPRITANEIKKVVMQTIAMLTDVKPRSEVIPAPLSHTGDDFALWLEHSARMLNHGTKAIWQNQDLDYQIEQSLLDMELMYKGIQKVVWNPLANGGLGDAHSFRVDPEFILVDPYCLTFDDAQYIVQRSPRPLNYIRRRWPDKGFKVQPDMALSTYVKDTPQSFMAKIGLRRYRQEDRYEQSAIPRAWVDEMWIIDPTIDKSTGLLLYPGRRVMTRAGNIMLQDTGNPFWDDMQPYVGIAAFPAIDQFWEEAPAMGYIDLQDMVNKFWSIMMSNATQMGNTQWIGDKDALSAEGWDNLGNAPGGVIQVKPGRNLRREPPPNLPAWIMEAAKACGTEIKELAGLLDPGMMKAGGGMTPGGFVDSMVLALQAVIRYKARALERAQQEIGVRLVSRMLQFYTERRVMMMEGLQGWESMTWDPELVVPPVAGTDRETMIRWAIKRYQYRVTPGSSLTLSKEKAWAISAALFGMQAIDKEALLEDVEYPRRQEVTARMKKEEEKKAMLAMLQGGGQPPAGQAGPRARAQQPYKSRSAASSIIKGLTRSATRGAGG